MAVADDRQARAAVTRLAPAKLNLFLHVVGRRADGYHLLQSLVAFADLGDRVSVAPAPDGSFTLRLTGPFADAIDGAAEDNLVLRAARALAARLGRGGASIMLEKSLPVAAGIGGGSADAAAALSALAELWGADISPQELQALALGLGADVPACLAGRPVLMEGIGERLTPCAIPQGLGVLLANPGTPLSTSAIFADFRVHEGFSPEGPIDLPEGRLDWLRAVRERHNDLERPARRICPEVVEALDLLGGLQGVEIARMSGSGATCFGLFAEPAAAAAGAARLAALRPGWWTAAGTLLNGAA